jgi:hypothetical protein
VSLNNEFNQLKRKRDMENKEDKMNSPEMVSIPKELYDKLNYLGIIPNDIRKNNVGKSNYSQFIQQPWSIIQEYNLGYLDGDTIKRTLRTKQEEGMTMIESKIMDAQKIIHIQKEKLRRLTILKDSGIESITNI